MTASLASWRLDWEHGTACVISTAGMLHNVAFRLRSGRVFAPFARAHWASPDADRTDLAGHMRWLGGEFACLPFGVGGPVGDVAPEWSHLPLSAANNPPHGPAANAEWHLVEYRPGFIRIALAYPDAHPVVRVERTILTDPSTPALDLTVTIHARRVARISAGVHPILSLALPPAALHLSGTFRQGLTYPARVPGDAMVAAIGKRFTSLDAVPSADGGTVDLSRLPFGRPVEDVVQLCGMEGPVVARFPVDGISLSLDWDRSLLPSCQLWISDRALSSEPWSGRFQGLGVEPIASAFDFADDVSTADNPIACQGFPTSIQLDPTRPTTIRYRLEACED